MKSSDTQGIDILLKKLGHQIPEIRTRALESLISKLNHGLLQESDLTQEKKLFVGLLEWFNFKPAPIKEKVFELLQKLSKYSSSCDLLVSIGAVSFLSLLRSDLNNEEKVLLDVILDRLFHVTNYQITESKSKQCIYGNPKSLNNSSDISTTKSEDEVQYGYFDSTTTTTIDSSELLPANSALKLIENSLQQSKCFKFGGFPWHPLTATDHHVLASTADSLCSPKPTIVTNACSFLLNVIFRDFPSEIFLQRPAIVQCLITFVSSRPHNKLLMESIDCLKALTDGLISRINFFQDPSFYCPRQGVLVNESREDSIRTLAEGGLKRIRGDGRNDSSTSTNSSSKLQSSSSTWNSSLDDLTDFTDQQHLELSPAHFLLTSLLSCLPLLKTSSCQLSLHLLKISSSLIRLFDKTIDSNQMWKEDSMSAQSLRSLTCQLLELFGEVVLYHHHFECNKLSAENGDWKARQRSQSDSITHRVIFQSLASLLIQLLETTLPMNQVATQMRSNVTNALYVIACDWSMLKLMPAEVEAARSFLKRSSSSLVTSLHHVSDISRAFSDMHHFTRQFKQEMTSEQQLEVMQMAFRSLDAIPLYYDVTHLRDIIKAISRVFLNERPGQAADVTSQKLRDVSKRALLRLMSHPIDKIRQLTYDVTQRIVCDVINVTCAAEDPNMKSSHVVRFLLDTEVLYEVCSFAFTDSCLLVSSSVEQVMSVLLQGRHLVSDDVWWDFQHTLHPVLVLLQAHTSHSDQLMSALNSYFDLEDQEDLDVIRFCLRGLMLKSRRCRIESSNKLKKYLSLKHPEMKYLPDLTDLFFVENPSNLHPSVAPLKRSPHQEEEILYILKVLVSEEDTNIKTRSLHQLILLIEDEDLLKVFISNDGFELILSQLHQLASDRHSVVVDKSFLAVCLSVIKTTLRGNSVLRSRQVNNKQLLLDLIRSVYICRLTSSRDEISIIISLLIFDDVLRVFVHPTDEGSDRELSLPSVVFSCYQIPFICPVHDSNSSHRIPNINLSYLLEGPSGCFLRQSWNQFNKQPPSDCKLKMTKTDDLHLIFSSSSQSSQHLLQMCLEAQCHSLATRSLNLLRIFISCSRLVRDHLLRDEVFRQLLTKYLQKQPSCQEDEMLLISVTSLLEELFQTSYIPFLVWFIDAAGLMTSSASRGLLYILQSPLLPPDSRVLMTSSATTRRKLCARILSLISIVSTSGNFDFRTHTRLQRALHGALLTRLKLAHAPNYYDLSSVEGALTGFVHISSGDDVINDHQSLRQLFKTLLEIVIAFDARNGHASRSSFMGKGVRRAASQCVLHISRLLVSHDVTNWPSWFIDDHVTEIEDQLKWLVSLWSARDPRTRFCGLGIASLMSSSFQGAKILSQIFQQTEGGLWGLSLAIFLDHSECSAVRSSACDVITNLLRHPFTNSNFKGPVVLEDEHSSPLEGVCALISLLRHTNVIDHIHLLLTSYYPHSFVRSSCNIQRQLNAEIPADSESSFIFSTPNSVAMKFGETNSVKGTASVSSDEELQIGEETLVETWRAISTPNLISSVSNFLVNCILKSPKEILQNFIDNKLLQNITSLIDCERMTKIISKIDRDVCDVSKKRRKLLISDLQRQNCSILHLLKISFYFDNKFLDVRFVDKITPLMTSQQAFETRDLCFEVMTLLLNLPVEAMMIGCWDEILSSNNLTKDLNLSQIIFISNFFKKIQQNYLKLSELLPETMSQSGEIASVLIESFQMIVPSLHISSDLNDRMKTLSQALCNIFLCSRIAKDVAIKVQFLESCIRSIDHLNKNLQSSAVILTRDLLKDVNLDPLMSLMSLCINLMFEDTKMKLRASQSNLGVIIHRLWRSSLLFPTSFQLLLMKLILNFTSNCEEGSTTSLIFKLFFNLFSAIITLCSQSDKTSATYQLVQGIKKSPNPHLMINFQILINCSSLSEFRTLIWKANLLQIFPSVVDHFLSPLKRCKYQFEVLNSWLCLLLTLSFHTDGQQNILKISDIFVMFLHLHNNDQIFNFHLIRIIRNLCFHSSSKPRISSSKPVITLMISGLQHHRLITLSAICSLLSNNQKAKVHLKGSGLLKVLRDLFARLNLAQDEGIISPEDVNVKNSLQKIINQLE